MATAFVVMGQSGEYSDWREWVVAVFTDKDAAEEWARGAAAYVETYKEVRRTFYDDPLLDHYGVDFDKRPAPASPFDARLTDDCEAADASYGVAPAPLNPEKQSPPAPQVLGKEGEPPQPAGKGEK